MAVRELLIYALAWSSLHSILACSGFKNMIARLVKPFWFRFYRLAYNLISLFSLLPLLAIYVRSPDRSLYTVPMPWAAMMLLGEVLALAALLLAFRQTDIGEFLGLRQLSVPDQSPPARLVTTGFYRYVRHPLYTAGLAILWLFPFMTFNMFALDLVLTFYILVGAGFEERRLAREFGLAYREYKAVTPMFIPFLKGNKARRKTS
jgi:protein-S-isoprenylcysteine O-methyltransferase Ste14